MNIYHRYSIYKLNIKIVSVQGFLGLQGSRGFDLSKPELRGNWWRGRRILDLGISHCCHGGD